MRVLNHYERRQQAPPIAPKHERPTHEKQKSIVLNSIMSKPLHVDDLQTLRLKETSEKRLETTHKRTNVVRFLSSPRT